MSEKRTYLYRISGPAMAILLISLVPISEVKAAVLPDNSVARQDILSEVQALYGLTEEQAIKRLAAEVEAAELDRLIRHSKIEGYAGSWFDARTWTLRVAISNPSDAAFIEDLGGTPVLVARSLQELRAIRALAETRLAENPATRNVIWETYIDYRSNQVVIGTAPGRLAQVESVLAIQGFSPESVEVIVTESSSFSADVRGANSMCDATLDTPAPDPTACHAHPCSVGASVVGGYVTAGHCGEVTDTVRTDPPSSSQLLGQIDGSTMTIVDIDAYPNDPNNDDGWTYSFAHNEDGAFVDTASGWTPKPTINGYPEGVMSVSAEWSGMLEAPVGATVCRYGQTTSPNDQPGNNNDTDGVEGANCGDVLAKDMTLFNGDQYLELNGMTKVDDICSEDGDSGGPFVTPGGQVQGTLSTGKECPPSGVDFGTFQPVATTLRRFNNKTMLTTHGSNKPTINGFNCPVFVINNNWRCRIDSFDSQGVTTIAWSASTGASSDTVLLVGGCADGQTVNVSLAVTNPYGTRNRSTFFTCSSGPPE